MKLIDTIVYAGRVKDKENLLKSSSGGAFTALSDYFLDHGNAVVAAVYNYESHETEYRLLLTKTERDSAIGSKYMQSKLGDIFRKAYQWLMMHHNGQLLFIGMGCQADGFRIYAEKKGIRERVYIVDIVCHGSPSPKLWREYVESLEKKKGKITYLTFKDKRNGWKSPTAIVNAGGEEISIKDYVKVFYSQCSLRPSCHECPYASTTRKIDITIGDFWNIDKTIPDFYDPFGNSLFLIHTDQGEELFDSIKQNLEYRLSDVKQCWQYNLEAPTPVSHRRSAFWKDYQSKGIDFIMRKYGTESLKVKVKNKIRKLIGGGVHK